MTRNPPARFHWRAFVTLYVTLSFVLLAASGIVLYRGQEKPKEIPAGGGYGGKSVGEVCTQLEIPLDEGLERLRARGIEAQSGTPLKGLAERHGRRPHDLVQILAGA